MNSSKCSLKRINHLHYHQPCIKAPAALRSHQHFESFNFSISIGFVLFFHCGFNWVICLIYGDLDCSKSIYGIYWIWVLCQVCFMNIFYKSVTFLLCFLWTVVPNFSDAQFFTKLYLLHSHFSLLTSTSTIFLPFTLRSMIHLELRLNSRFILFPIYRFLQHHL